MNYNFKPGDLAMIVGCDSNPEDIGKIVTLDQLVTYMEVFTVFGERGRCISPGLSWVCMSEDVISNEGIRGFVLVDPAHLMPLRGDFAPENQKSQELPA